VDEPRELDRVHIFGIVDREPATLREDELQQSAVVLQIHQTQLTVLVAVDELRQIGLAVDVAIGCAAIDRAVTRSEPTHPWVGVGVCRCERLEVDLGGVDRLHLLRLWLLLSLRWASVYIVSTSSESCLPVKKIGDRNTMSTGLAIVGTIAAGYVLDQLSQSNKDHDDVLKDTYQAVSQAAAADSSLYVDHIDVDAAGNPRSATPGTDHVPDLVLTGFADNSIVVEVETGDSLNGDALDQLEDFSKPGYTRALVVPDSVVDDGIQFIEEYTDAATANIVVCGPSDTPKLL